MNEGRKEGRTLTACSRVLEKLTVPQQVPTFYATEGSLPHSQQLANGPYPEPHKSRSQPLSLSLPSIFIL